MLDEYLSKLMNLMDSDDIELDVLSYIEYYNNAINTLMSENLHSDAKEFISRASVNYTDDNFHELVDEETTRRMRKYSSEMFDAEINIVLDEYNAGLLTEKEFEVKCTVLLCVRGMIEEHEFQQFPIV
jgi:hypothetical protein